MCHLPQKIFKSLRLGFDQLKIQTLKDAVYFAIVQTFSVKITTVIVF